MSDLDKQAGPPAVGTILGSMDPSDLLRAADHVRELEGHPGWEFLEGLMKAHMEKATFQYVGGSLRGIEAYAHGAGFIKGLRATIDVRAAVLATAVNVRAAERENGEAT